MVGEAHTCCCDTLFCVRCMSDTTCHVALWPYFVRTLWGVAWRGVVCIDICLLGCSFVHSFALCSCGSCCFLLLQCGCTILLCEVVLNYVEVGAIACDCCAVVSVELWCSDAL